MLQYLSAPKQIYVHGLEDSIIMMAILLLMVNFMCQPVEVTRCLDIWSNIILGVPVRALEEINI